ncbi:Myotubularin-like protein [Quillaja saponaria]|uniref:Myotubularin-like protein n=1 Tax=Quillaja saponaria TaxID=32244 RepID=A0AAD7PSB8_QUISA|nr:Myotubularin-like protein [Quillaja saponaria]
MGNEHRRHHHHQHHMHNQKGTFLPMLCSKPSIKDVRLPRREDRSDSFSNDPLSPRIGCMVKYSKLKKLFSGKNICSPNTNTTTASSCGISRKQLVNNGATATNKYRLQRSETFVCVSIEEMDPPLPVTKRPAEKSAEGGEEEHSPVEKEIWWSCIEKSTAPTDSPSEAPFATHNCLMKRKKETESSNA